MHKTLIIDPAASEQEITFARPFLAIRPFIAEDNGWMRDANGDRVIVCSDEPEMGCDLFYSERLVENDAWFICPRCGRLGQRMEEASHSNALLYP